MIKSLMVVVAVIAFSGCTVKYLEPDLGTPHATLSFSSNYEIVKTDVAAVTIESPEASCKDAFGGLNSETLFVTYLPSSESFRISTASSARLGISVAHIGVYFSTSCSAVLGFTPKNNKKYEVELKRQQNQWDCGINLFEITNDERLIIELDEYQAC